jgi:hypothetical protein
MEALANKGVPFHDPRITPNDPKFDPKLFQEVDEERVRIERSWLNQAGFPTKLALAGLAGLNSTILRAMKIRFIPHKPCWRRCLLACGMRLSLLLKILGF